MFESTYIFTFYLIDIYLKDYLKFIDFDFDFIFLKIYNETSITLDYLLS